MLCSIKNDHSSDHTKNFWEEVQDSEERSADKGTCKGLCRRPAYSMIFKVSSYEVFSPVSLVLEGLKATDQNFSSKIIKLSKTYTLTESAEKVSQFTLW
jgi:hypothetical protein